MLPPVVLSVWAAYGTFLLYTAWVFGWRGIGPGPTHREQTIRRRRWDRWQVAARLARAGLADVKPAQFAAVVAVLFIVGSAFTFALFGAVTVALCGGGVLGLAPVAAHRRRAERRRDLAREAWPRLIEEVRLLTSSIGRSIPQALFEVGSHVPSELQPAFRAAEREWLISTDFRRTLSVLKDQLAEPTADVICETLLVAYEVGGNDLEGKLAALAEDRSEDLQNRRDAIAHQAGVRFARRFVLIVPLGMALAGLTIGAGRSSYQSSAGQVALLVAVLTLAVCWIWAGRLLRLPQEGRVFDA